MYLGGGFISRVINLPADVHNKSTQSVCRPAHDRARLASMVGMFGPAFRNSTIHSSRGHAQHISGYDAHSAPRASRAASHALPKAPMATGAARRRMRRTTCAPKGSSQGNSPTAVPVTPGSCKRQVDYECSD